MCPEECHKENGNCCWLRRRCIALNSGGRLEDCTGLGTGTEARTVYRDGMYNCEYGEEGGRPSYYIMNVKIVVVCAQGLKSIIHTRLGR